MRIAAALLVLLPALPACAPDDDGSHARASAEDEKAIAECVSDNKSEGARREVVLKYCTCMNDQMEDHETLSISEWEEKNPAAVKACDKVAGWK